MGVKNNLSKIAVFVGSVRSDRNGIFVARWIETKLKERNHDVFFIDPMELQFLYWIGCTKKCIVLNQNTRNYTR
ncbi:MAG: hypothetical protein EPO37_02755 [Nitrosarchaeum sp.]|nr:MAG: hypothetical protein EPO37_02755 [Nitrosarchaeum sp.]